MKDLLTPQGPLLQIDNLNLRLPPGYEQRADAIARETVRRLAELPLSQSSALKQLDLPPLKLNGGETNSVIARRIAGAIHGRISDQGRGGAS